MGWGNKAIEIRSVETGHLDGVFMHKKAQRLKFLCERNDKVSPAWHSRTSNFYFGSNFSLTLWARTNIGAIFNKYTYLKM